MTKVKHLETGKVIPCALTGKPKWRRTFCGYVLTPNEKSKGKLCPVCEAEAARFGVS